MIKCKWIANEKICQKFYIFERKGKPNLILNFDLSLSRFRVYGTVAHQKENNRNFQRLSRKKKNAAAHQPNSPAAQQKTATPAQHLNRKKTATSDQHLSRPGNRYCIRIRTRGGK